MSAATTTASPASDTSVALCGGPRRLMALRGLRSHPSPAVGVLPGDVDADLPERSRSAARSSRSRKMPGFPTDRSINWYLPLACCMGSAFSGVGLGFSTVARPARAGFFDRLRMAPTPQSVVDRRAAADVPGSASLIVVTVVLGRRASCSAPGSPAGCSASPVLYVAGFGIATVAAGWGLGLAYPLPRHARRGADAARLVQRRSSSPTPRRR